MTAPTAVFVLWFRSEAAAGDKGGTLNTAPHGAQRKATDTDICLLIVFLFSYVFLCWFFSGLSPQVPYVGLACFFTAVGIPVFRLCFLSGERREYAD